MRSSLGPLAALSLTMLLASLGTSIANVALPALAGAFAAPFQQVQWVVLAYLLAITTLIVGAGRLGDLTGRRRLLLAGLALFTGASALAAAAPTLGWLIAARAAQGLGAAAMMALTLALVAAAVPKERTGRAMGLMGTMSAIGTALGPSLGGLLIAGPGWRAVFWVMVPLGLLSLGLGWRHLPADRPCPAARQGFDPAGTLLLAATLGAYALAVTLGRGQFGLMNLGLALAAALGAVLFLRVEARVAAPLIRLQTLRDPALATSLGTTALVATVMMATLVVGPFYLSGALGLGAAGVGLVLAAGPVVSALTGVPAGRLADRFGARRMVLAGLAVLASGLALLALVPAGFGIPGYLFPIVLATAGYATFQAANTTAVMRDVAPDRRGTVSGILTLSRNLGLVTGASAMGAVFALASGGPATAGPEALARGLHATFALAALMIVLALALAARTRARQA